MIKKYLNTTTLTSVIILMAVVLIAISSGRFSRRGIVEYFFQGDIGKICTNKYCLENKEGSWFIVEGNSAVPAESENVEATVTRLKEIRLDELISDNQQRFLSLGLAEENITLLTINGKTLEIGNIERSYSGTYVREKDGNKVFKISIILDKDNLNDKNYWLMKNLTNIPIYQMKKVLVNNKEILPDETGNWTNEEFAEKISNVRALSFVGKETGAKSVEYKIETEIGDYYIYLRKVDLDKKQFSYQASKDGEYFFEIGREDFDLLTAVLN